MRRAPHNEALPRLQKGEQASVPDAPLSDIDRHE
jgi:hypothetical protein